MARSGATSERGTAIAQAAEAEGVRPTKALEVAENPTALLSLIDELEEDEDAGTWAAEAFDSMRSLVAEAVEADPELRVQERRLGALRGAREGHPGR
ncbi:hypothetical protein SUDANB96_00569 [Streptomyces sp. enrichment culture]